jgi:hypothetical protein
MARIFGSDNSRHLYISGLKEAVEELLNPKDTNETVSEGGNA